MIENRDIKEIQISAYHHKVQVDTAKLFTRTKTLPSYQELQIFGTYSKKPENVLSIEGSAGGGRGLPVRENVNVSNQGCISCGILVSGIWARGASSEHMENMEMFSCSPT